MSRMVGTVSMGIRAPIIRQNDDLVSIVTDCVVKAMENGELIIESQIGAGTRAVILIPKE